jgi:hypothetical protein
MIVVARDGKSEAVPASDEQSIAAQNRARDVAVSLRPPMVGPSTYPVNPAWTKMGPTLAPTGVPNGWPTDPFTLLPWGPVTWKTGPLPDNKALVALGFPPADGTPLSQANFQPWIRIIRGQTDVVLWDFVSRALHRVPSLIPLSDRLAAGITQRDGMLLITVPDPSGLLKLVDLLTGGIDTLPEIQEVDPAFNGNLSWRGWFIVYTTLHEGRRQVALFDRRTRTINRLSRLNGNKECFAPAIDQMGRNITFVTIRNGQQDIAIYDTITGLTDPLPAVNTDANEFAPYLSDDARWLVFIRGADQCGRILIYDRLTGGIDPLPDLNTLCHFRTTGLTTDGLVIGVTYLQDGHRRGALYLRPSGLIDPLPEVNDSVDQVYF